MFTNDSNPLIADFKSVQLANVSAVNGVVEAPTPSGPPPTEPMFTADVIDAITRNEGVAIDRIPGLARTYLAVRDQIPGAPPIEELLPIHVAAIVEITSFRMDADRNWDRYVARVQENQDFEQNANNPFYPKWFGKTDDKPSIWMQDTGEIDDLNQAAMNQLFYQWQRPWDPKQIDAATKTLKPAPVSDQRIMRSIVDALVKFPNTLLRPMGTDTGKNSEFRWSSTLPMLASLGYDAFRYFAAFVAQHSDEEEFQHWRSVPDKNLTEDLTNAIKMSGYPINIGSVDCTDMIQILERCKLTQAPRWLPSLILIHVMKHVRYYRNLNGEPCLFAAYRGRHAFVPLTDGAHSMPLCAGANKNTMQMLQYVLRISGGSGKKKTPCEIAVAGVLNEIHPNQITLPIPAHQRPDIITAPSVQFQQSIPNQHERKRMWIDPGIAVHNVGQFNSNTGIVNPDDAITGEWAVSLEWPRSDKSPDELKNWLFELPRQIFPMRPSQLVSRFILNINDLGCPKGLWHIYDGLLLAGMLLPELAGSEMGLLLGKEQPPLWALPMGSTMDETTNQGKTNFCVLTAKILVPNIDHMVFSGTTSPPAQRSAASPIERFGTAVYDEFVMPTHPDHFLHSNGFVSLATGGTANPGRAMENSQGIRLKHGLFLAAKSGPELVDVKNRSFMIFMDQLTPENKCGEKEVGKILSGSASAYLRLSAIMWLNKHDIASKVRALDPANGKWRFNAHLAIIRMLAGDEYPEVERYLELMWAQCDAQRHNVGDSNLMGELGYREKFNPSWYFETASDGTLDSMYAQCKSKGPIRSLDAIRALVEDGFTRKFSAELALKLIQEQGAAGALTKALRNGPFERGAYTIRLSLEPVKTAGRQKVPGVIVEKHGA